MADLHKAEQILQAVTTLLDTPGLTTTGTNVERGRFRAVSGEKSAELTVTQGEMKAVREPSVSFQDVELEVVITAHAKGADDVVETSINTIAAEVYAAMMANRTLGLAFVIDTAWQSNSQPNLNAMNQNVIDMDMRFAVTFRHSYTDATA